MYAEMAENRRLLKHEKALKIFVSLFERDKTLKELVFELYKDKVQLEEVSIVECPHCAHGNVKKIKEILEVERVISNNSTNLLPDLRCASCRKRLIKRRKNIFLTKHRQELFLKLPKNLLRSVSGRLQENEIRGLLKLGLIKRIGRTYSMDYRGFYSFIPFWNQMGPAKIKDDRKLAKSRANDLFRDYILIRRDFKSLEEVFTDITISLGKIWPGEFQSLFRKGYTGYLNEEEAKILMRLQKDCSRACDEESMNKYDFTYSIYAKLNKIKYDDILRKEEKHLKQDGDELIAKEIRAERLTLLRHPRKRKILKTTKSFQK